MLKRKTQPQVVIHQLSPELSRQLDSFISVLQQLVIAIGKRKERHSTFEGGKIMRTIPDNTPDIPIEIAPYTSGKDEEGAPVDVSGFGYQTLSDDPAGILFVPAADSPVDAQGNALKGALKVGGPKEEGSVRTANVTINVVDANGKVVAVLGGEQYNVTSGAFAAGVGGGVTIAEPQPPPGA
jgi:hypothetical protein